MAASRYEVEVTVSSARDLKNVNWRNGDLKPYAVLWLDAGAKCSTRVDLDNGDAPVWDQKLLLPLPPSSALHDAVLYVDVVHANASEGVKPLVGSARLPLRDVLDDAGVGGKATSTLRLKRPSGRPQGKLDVRVAVKEPSRYYDYPPPPAAGAYYQHQQSSYRDPAAAGYGGYGSYGAAGAGYGGAAQPYATAPPAGYPAAASAYGYGAPPPPVAAPAYGSSAPPAVAASSAYGSSAAPVAAVGTKKNNKMGMGTGLAVGAAAGVLGGLALAGGASYLENKLEDRVAERVEEDLYDDDDDDY